MSKNGFELEQLREYFQDTKIHFAVGKVEELDPAVDFHSLRLKVQLFPDEISIVAKATFPNVGPDSGFISFPEVGDLCIVAFADGDEQQAFVIGYLPSLEDTIPLRAWLGDAVLQSRSGKELNLSSDSQVNIGRGNPLIKEDEPLVLGNVLKDALTDMYDKFDQVLDKLISGPIAIGNLGVACPTEPTLAIGLTAIKSQLAADKVKYIDLVVTNIVSQIAFTER